MVLQGLDLAKNHYQKARNQVYFAALLNDLAFLYKTSKNFEKAHEMIDASSNTFKKIKDRSREGFSLDTKANIYYEEGKFDEASKICAESYQYSSKSEKIRLIWLKLTAQR